MTNLMPFWCLVDVAGVTDSVLRRFALIKCTAGMFCLGCALEISQHHYSSGSHFCLRAIWRQSAPLVQKVLTGVLHQILMEGDVAGAVGGVEEEVGGGRRGGRGGGGRGRGRRH